ncbi:MAG: inositol monophosphatase, partial [Lewinellaceae bacterium]|nr:inositol monophosphatase [Lewinellaceae bacterium]
MEKSPAFTLEELCHQTVMLVEQVGEFITGQLGQVEQGQIETKSLNSLVSYVDTTAEQKLIAGLQAILPQAVFRTEEETIAPAEGEWCWIIDPLDGTTNFLHQLPCFAISVALAKGQQVVLGVVQEINRRETFWAWKAGGAFCNGRPIHVSTTNTLAESLVSTGFPYYDFSRLPAYLEALTYLMQHTRGIRRWGAAAVDLAYVACGRYDAFFEYALNP